MKKSILALALVSVFSTSVSAAKAPESTYYKIGLNTTDVTLDSLDLSGVAIPISGSDSVGGFEFVIGGTVHYSDKVTVSFETGGGYIAPVDVTLYGYNSYAVTASVSSAYVPLYIKPSYNVGKLRITPVIGARMNFVSTDVTESYYNELFHQNMSTDYEESNVDFSVVYGIEVDYAITENATFGVGYMNSGYTAEASGVTADFGTATLQANLTIKL